MSHKHGFKICCPLHSATCKSVTFIHNTSVFVNEISQIENITKDTFLVALDVKSLHTNIPNREGIETAKSFKLKAYIATEIIIRFLFLIFILIVSSLMDFTIFTKWDVLWVQHALQTILPYL